MTWGLLRRHGVSCLALSLTLALLTVTACGDDSSGTDSGPVDGGTDTATDSDVCVPDNGAIFEPLWIAGQTGPYDEVGFFGRPDAIFVDGDRLLAGDEEPDRDELHIFDLTSDDTSVRGDFLTPIADIGAFGQEPMQFWAISGFARDEASGNIYVVENRNARIQILGHLDEAPYYEHVGFLGMLGDYMNPPPGTFFTPQAARTDSMGRLYVTDDGRCDCPLTARHDVQVFSPTLEFLEIFGDREGASGEGGNLAEPENFAIDEGRDRIYVCDETAENVVIFRYSDRSFVQRFTDLLGNPNGVDLDQSGNIYIVDEGNDLTTMVRVFEPDGLTEVFRFGNLTAEDDLRGGYFNSPDTLIIDIDKDLLIVADQGHDRIQGFALSEIRERGCLN